MNITLLKKTALQSITLMIVVIFLSYANQQNQLISRLAKYMAGLEKLSTSDIISSEANNASQGNRLLPNNIYALINSGKAKNPMITELLDKVNQNISKKLGNKYILIKKPKIAGISYQLNDMYINQSIRITMNGLRDKYISKNLIARVNHDKVFFGNPINYLSSNIDTIKEERDTYDPAQNIKIKTSYNTIEACYNAVIDIKLDSLYAYETYEDDNYYLINLKKPKELYDKVLVIDAGHGGKDAGALSNNNYFYEKNINLDILLQLKELLDKKNIKVYYTRTGDDKVYLRPRVELANAANCDFFISIHNNANMSSLPNGSEILYYNYNYHGVNNRELSEIFINELGKSIPIKNRGLVEESKDNIYILKKAKVPAILIEVGYMTNTNDMYFLSREVNRRAIAQGIYNGIMKAYDIDIFKKMGSGR